MTSCKICKCDHGTIHQVRERMFGFGDQFEYFECSECGCLQLSNPPSDMGRYYPADSYYSFNDTLTPSGLHARNPLSWKTPFRPIKRWYLKRLREAVLFESDGTFRALAKRHPYIENWAKSFKTYVADSSEKSFRTRILDVGCGNGSLLSRMADFGFERLEGIDPYIEKTVMMPGFRVRKIDLNSLKSETYDVIMMNHSLEHIPDQLDTLRAIRGLLATDGVCRIEVPVAGCEAWAAYGTEWVGIDAPRHYFLHTRKSMEILAPEAGLKIYRAENVEDPFEFWGSELYRRGITLFDPEARRMRDPLTVFTEAEMAEFARRSAEANRNGRGHIIAFHLRRGA